MVLLHFYLEFGFPPPWFQRVDVPPPPSFECCEAATVNFRCAQVRPARPPSSSPFPLGGMGRPVTSLA